jgi:RNA polymerase sigma factor (sigma-70 family)
MSEQNAPPAARTALLYHYCRMQLPAVVLSADTFVAHLTRTFNLFAAKSPPGLTWEAYFDQLYALDWYLCSGCLENDNRAWEALFATRTGRSDCLLIDALRARAVRLYPRNEEKQEAAVTEFWSHLLVSESPGSVPVLARYDGQRPLAPWLIRVFQNWHVSQIRSHPGSQTLPEDDIALPLPVRQEDRWHDLFCSAARDWLTTLSEQEVLLLGLRWRYRLSQRDISHLFGVHEGTISRQTDKLRDRCLERIGKKLTAEGWTGDDLEGFILTELGSLLVDDPRLSADQLTAMLARRGKTIDSATGGLTSPA